CLVLTRSASPGVVAVATYSFYVLKVMPDGSVNWSCSNESQETLCIQNEKVARCYADFDASCTAAMTQETLANHKSSSANPPANEPNVPDAAQVVTYFYGLEDRTQARSDCERGGGKWQDR